jgi:hypothetical protein
VTLGELLHFLQQSKPTFFYRAGLGPVSPAFIPSSDKSLGFPESQFGLMLSCQYFKILHLYIIIYTQTVESVPGQIAKIFRSHARMEPVVIGSKQPETVHNERAWWCSNKTLSRNAIHRMVLTC